MMHFPKVKYVHCGKDDPGEDQSEQSEGYCFGLIVIFVHCNGVIWETDMQQRIKVLL